MNMVGEFHGSACLSNTHLFQQELGRSVDDDPHVAVVARVADVAPSQEGHKEQPHEEVAELSGDVEANVACEARAQVEGDDEAEDDGRGPEGAEDVLALVVLGEVLKELANFLQQLFLIALAELLAPHLLDALEVLQGQGTLHTMLLLQHFGGHVRLVSTTQLRGGAGREERQ